MNKALVRMDFCVRIYLYTICTKNFQKLLQFNAIKWLVNFLGALYNTIQTAVSTQRGVKTIYSLRPFVIHFFRAHTDMKVCFVIQGHQYKEENILCHTLMKSMIMS